VPHELPSHSTPGPGFPPLSMALPDCAPIRLIDSLPNCKRITENSALSRHIYGSNRPVDSAPPSQLLTFNLLATTRSSFMAELKADHLELKTPLTPIIRTHAICHSLTAMFYVTCTHRGGRGTQLLLISIRFPPQPWPMTSVSLHLGARSATMAKSRLINPPGKHFLPLRCLILRADKGWLFRPT
jgi:hypothetical protein